MILIDTSVLVDYLRSPADRTLRLFEKNGAAICGVTRAEVLAGARNPTELDRIAQSLDVLTQVEIGEGLWDILGKNLSILRASRVTVPFADALIATLAIKNGLELWTRDMHFVRIQGILTGLWLFQEPAEVIEYEEPKGEDV
jgi:predicted nucleic acid-binding protein